MSRIQRFFAPFLLISLTLLLAAGAAGCSAPAAAAQGLVQVSLNADGKQQDYQVPAGTSVQSVLDQAGVKLGALDRVNPAAYSVLTKTGSIQVVRVREEFEVKENVIPFEGLTVKNEALPEGQTRRIQPGENGLQQITTRRVYEDGKQVSEGVFKIVTVKEARPEIVMVGVQTPFSSIPIHGKLVYLTAGNAWLMEETTGKRRPVATSGDLDGRVFSLSPDGSWLLYTRKAADENKDRINSLWAVSVETETPQPVNLKVDNVIHYAEWVPGAISTITYSTVEPRAAAPGWQANNDLHRLSFTASGAILRNEQLVEANSGGIYGWWGTTYRWSPDGTKLAYARPDGVGLVNTEDGSYIPLMEMTPLQTRSDWAWVPGLSWSADNLLIYTVSHAVQAGMNAPEESPLFEVTAIPVRGGPLVAMVEKSGMFAYPVPSPLQDGGRFEVAYLQATVPEKSETSNYRLVLMDRDGSNREVVFPSEGLAGMEPQTVVWSPPGMVEQETWLGVIYQGNLWLLDPKTKQAQQVTGDGSITRMDWK